VSTPGPLGEHNDHGLKGAADVQRTFSNAEGSASVDGVVLGVDTHLDLDVAVALDQLGRRLGELTLPSTTRGYERLLRWAEGFGPVSKKPRRRSYLMLVRSPGSLDARRIVTQV
jgi:hypothetical protein